MFRTLGYLLNEDGSVEESDQYLKRMSGVLRFYAAIIQSSPPGGGRVCFLLLVSLVELWFE